MRIGLVVLFILVGISYAQVDPNGPLLLKYKVDFFQQKLEKLPDNEKSVFNRIRLLTDIGKAYLYSKRYRPALIYLLKAKNLNPDDDPKLGVYYTAFGQLFAEIGAYDAAIQYEKRIYFNRKGELDRYYSASSIGTFYKFLNEPDSAQLYLDYQLKAARKMNDYVAVASAWNNKGLAFLEVDKYAKALRSFKQANKLMHDNLRIKSESFESEKEQFIYIIYENLGRCYFEIGNFEQAIFYLETARRALQIKSVTQNDELLLRAYLKSSDLDKAARFLGELKKIVNCKKNDQAYLWCGINLIFSTETHGSNTSYWLAKCMESQKEHIRKSTLRSNKTSQLISVYMLNETKATIKNEKRSKTHVLNMLRIEKTRKTTVTILFLVGLGLLVMIGVVLNQIAKNKRKAYLLRNEKLELDNNLKELKIKTQDNHITEYALDFTKNMEYERNITSRLQQIAESDENSLLPELRSLVAELKQKFLIDKRAEELSRTSESVLGQFYDALLKTHPDLNKSEVQLCSLVRLELSNKEIALIKNVTPQSIKIFKNRLKRKLNIPSADSLTDYLKSIMFQAERRQTTNQS